MRKILLLMLVLLSSSAHAESPNSLKNFTGIWEQHQGGAALPSVACKKETIKWRQTNSQRSTPI